MNLLFFFLFSLLSQDDVLVEQGEVAVSLSDLDAYVHNLRPESRFGFVEDKGQVEKNILTLLNINFIHQYLQDKKLIDKKEFATALEAVESAGIAVDSQYADKLGLNESEFLVVLKSYALKSELFSRLNIYFQQEMLKGIIQSLAHDQFILEKSKYRQNEKRRLSVIQLSKENHNQAYAIDVLNQVIDGEDFNELAVKVSDDPSVLLNMGDWSFYSQDQFKYIFSTDVFSVKDLGVIPSVFETKEDYYLISVEEIIPPKDADFEDHKQRIVDELLPGLAKRKMQNIINEYSSKGDIKVNGDTISEVYQRYLVFEEDSK